MAKSEMPLTTQIKMLFDKTFIKHTDACPQWVTSRC